jgi:hypothetical protein
VGCQGYLAELDFGREEEQKKVLDFDLMNEIQI